MRRYELMLLLRPDLDDDRLQSAVEKVTRAIVNAGGSLSKVSPWGKRRLAYEIGHHREASYFLLHFDIEPAAVRGIERGLLLSEDILRHMVTVLEERGDQADGDGERRPRVPARAAASTESGPADGTDADGADADGTDADRATEEAVASSAGEAAEDDETEPSA
ncbi:MAG: 30S ribosomal protein S6 [Chloroflexota bacterium]|nr:30S ribosomal protein S6 [Chloroflexota bacterium]